jgi:hypothetical protein
LKATSTHQRDGGPVEGERQGTAKVREGLCLSSAAGDALARLVAGGREIGGHVERMAEENTRQSASGESIASRIQQLFVRSTESVDGVRQIARSVGVLHTRASRLKKLAARFSIRKYVQHRYVKSTGAWMSRAGVTPRVEEGRFPIPRSARECALMQAPLVKGWVLSCYTNDDCTADCWGPGGDGPYASHSDFFYCTYCP